MKLNTRRLFNLGAIALLVCLFSLDTLAQGNRGNARGQGQSGRPAAERRAPGPPAGITRGRPAGVEQGPPAGIVRGRANAANGTTLVGSDNRYRALANRLGRSPESIRDWYYAELGSNSNLNYGLFVAANNVALESGVSVGTILSGLLDGESLGQVKRRLGISGGGEFENEGRGRDRDNEVEVEDEGRGNVRNNNRSNSPQSTRPAPGGAWRKP